MDYKLPEKIEKIIEPPFTFPKFHCAVEELKEKIEKIDEMNALDNYMSIHVIASWISDHLNEISVLPTSFEDGKRVFMEFIKRFGRNNDFHMSHSNRAAMPGSLVTTENVFIDEISLAEVYAMDEDSQDPFCEKIVEVISQYKGKINARWYRSTIQMTPPHHCE